MRGVEEADGPPGAIFFLFKLKERPTSAVISIKEDLIAFLIISLGLVYRVAHLLPEKVMLTSIPSPMEVILRRN